MRLHRLTIEAFGPFADKVEIDFDELSGAGLFLLCGPTGAGKTSVLDAVCFALYGSVPGDRQGAKRLRSDHARPGVAPEVELEATLSGRRLRIIRSPSWWRPKIRGTGMTMQQPSVKVSEHVAGEWVSRSTKLDEAGQFIGGLLGMNIGQFTQVALLPQGNFHAFLRADAQDRRRLLQKLFRTGRYEAVERWLVEHRRTLANQSKAANNGVADLVSRTLEMTDAELPEEWDLADLAAPAGSGALLTWVTDLREEATTHLTVAQAAVAAASQQEADARRALDEARERATRHARVAAAAAEQTELLARTLDHQEDRRSLDAARRAAGVAPLHRLVAAKWEARQKAEASAQTATEFAITEYGPLAADAVALGRAVEETQESVAQVRAALPREERIAVVATEVSGHEARLGAARTALDELALRRESLPVLLTTAETELAAARDAEQAVAVEEPRLAELSGAIAAWTELATLDESLAAARASLVAATEAVAERAAELSLLQQARIDGLAAELAAVLQEGDGCPVCGSAEHPHKAQPAADAPPAGAEQQAAEALEAARRTELDATSAVRELETRHAVARHAAGTGTREDLLARHEALQASLAALRETAARRPALEEQVLAVRAEQERLSTDATAREVEAATATAAIAGLNQELASLTLELASLRGDAPDLSTRLEALLVRATTGREAISAAAELDAATRALQEAEEGLTSALSDAGFPDAAAALAAGLDQDAMAALEARVTQHETRLAAVAAVLAEPDAADLQKAAVPDVAAFEEAHRASLSALGPAQSHAAIWAKREQRLRELLADLGAALDSWAPLREQHQVAVHLSSFVEGKAADNREHMPLSVYVLAYRLSQVVAAANERLTRMSDQRYTLVHSGSSEGGQQGGLSLLVVDEWTGESRDPATLSGGETFVVSLALALGLADVIAHEAGGAELDTLFVDEGFGSLDAETLDQVMDTLDSLRDGGRVVGVVSHVSEMRDRIPVQLQVTKGRRGSSLALTHHRP